MIAACVLIVLAVVAAVLVVRYAREDAPRRAQQAELDKALYEEQEGSE